MTLKEAISFVREQEHLDVFSAKDVEAVGLVLEAAEKQIPKAPIVDDRYISELCPICHDFVRLPHGTPMNFCCNCGQRLLWWEDENEM